jgi:hypothetical protein
MSVSNTISPDISTPNKYEIDNWFSNIVDQIKADHFMITQDAAPSEKKSLYFDVINGNYDVVLTNMRQTASLFHIVSILKDYLSEIKNTNLEPAKLLVSLSDSKILVWAEINDDDDKTEDALLTIEAKINGKYYSKGFYVNSTIVEESDNIVPPPHYQKII